jgi:hypothetical protein
MNTILTVKEQASRFEQMARTGERHARTPSQMKSVAADYERAANLWKQANSEVRARDCHYRGLTVLAKARQGMGAWWPLA